MPNKNGLKIINLSLGQLYALYWSDLCCFLKAKYRGQLLDPEDIAQNAFARLAAAQKNKVIHNPQAFLYAAAKNLAIDEFRKQKTQRAHVTETQNLDADQKSYDENSPENVLLNKQQVGHLYDAMMRLPKLQRDVVVLHRLEGMTYTQIAKQLALSETSIRRYVANAIEFIHRELKRSNESQTLSALENSETCSCQHDQS